jgi:homoserine kinase type II
LGVQTKLSINEINKLIENSKIVFSSIQETKNGITDSTYIGTCKENKKYIFKIFETSTKEHIESEIQILNTLKEFDVPHPMSNHVVMLENKPTAIFSFIEGKISKSINTSQIDQISSFLKRLHLVKAFKPKIVNIYEKEYLLNMIESIKDENRQEFTKRFELIEDIDLQNNALIHGDLFPDNAKFIENRLNGVYDFAQSCYGNAYFDLAVMIISWCFDGDSLNMKFLRRALESYDKKIKTEDIKAYILYAALYYATQRYTRVNKAKDYKEMLKKFDIVKETLDV